MDHLNTPRSLMDDTGKVVWRWESDAFGSTQANEDPDGDSVKMTSNLRFPGQYYDVETGLHYNWHRYYDPSMGQYIQADPVGLAAGTNLYTYVGGNPMSYSDPLGLSPVGIAVGVGIRVVGGRAAAAAIAATARKYGPAGMVAACVLAGVCTFNEETKTPNSGEAGSCHVNPGSGQERKYGSDGKPEWDIDWDHDHGQGVPHGHNWDRGSNGEPIRGPGVSISPWPQGRGQGQ